jgi:hypothetical protein
MASPRQSPPERYVVVDGALRNRVALGMSPAALKVSLKSSYARGGNAVRISYLVPLQWQDGAYMYISRACESGRHSS